MWTVEQAQVEFSDMLARANAGQPQFIGVDEPCVVLALSEYERLMRAHNTPHLGRWLVENAPRIGDIDLPPRDRNRPVPFDDWGDDGEAAE